MLHTTTPSRPTKVYHLNTVPAGNATSRLKLPAKSVRDVNTPMLTSTNQMTANTSRLIRNMQKWKTTENFSTDQGSSRRSTSRARRSTAGAMAEAAGRGASGRVCTCGYWLDIGLLLVLDDRRHRGYPAARPRKPHDAHTLGRPASPADLVDARPDDLPGIGDEEDVVLVLHDQGPGQEAAGLGQLGGLDALDAPALAGVLLQRGALAVAGVGDHQQVGVRADHLHGQHLVVASQPHGGHAARLPTHRADVGLAEAYGHALAGDEQQVVVARGELDPDELIVASQVDRDQSHPRRVVLAEGGLLDHAVLGTQDEELTIVVVVQVEHCCDLLVRLECRSWDVGHIGAAGVLGRLGQLVYLHPVDPAPVGEEQHPVVGVGDGQELDDVVLFEVGPADPAAAPVLGPVVAQGNPLDVAGPGAGNHHRLGRDQVLDRQLALVGADLGPARVGEAAPGLQQLLLDDPAHLGGVVEDGLELGDPGLELGVLLLELAALEGGQAAQLHVEDGGGLDLRERVALHQLGPGDVGRLGVADEVDDLVEVVEGDQQALEDVGPLLGLAQLVAGPADDHGDLVGEVVRQHLGQVEHPGHAVDQGQHDHAEAVLELGVLVELVEDDLGDGVAAALDDQAGAFLVGLVGDVDDAVEAALADQVADPHQQAVAGDLVGQLGH